MCSSDLLVEVPESGTVTVPVTVPDTLTSWRVLALGQTRSGAQGGAITTFASTLPAYVDVVVPTFLYTGDRVQLPVQAVNQLGDPLSAPLTVEADGIPIGGGSVSVGGYGSTTQRVTLPAIKAGSLHVLARLGSIDTVDRVVPVRQLGRPIEKVRAGTLGDARTFPLSGSPGGVGGSLLVTAFPGALGVVGDELAAAVQAHEAWICEETLALTLRLGAHAEEPQVDDQIDGQRIRIWLAQA